MSDRLTWRRAGVLLQSASLGCIAIAGFDWIGLIVGIRDPSDDPHGYARFFGSIFLTALIAIGLIGLFGLQRWWRSGRDTALIAYDVFAILFAAQFLDPAYEHISDAPVVDVGVLAPIVMLTGFMVLTVASALTVYSSRPPTTEASGNP